MDLGLLTNQKHDWKRSFLFMNIENISLEAEDHVPAEKKVKDILDKQYYLKKFFKAIFNGFELEDGEHIRILQTNEKTNFKKVSYFNNVDDLISFTTNKHRVFNNTYFNLCSTNGSGGSDESLIKRYVLGFDFDKKHFEKGFNHKNVMEKFKNLGLWYHMIVDSGNGYHAYMIIEATNDLDKVQEVQDALGKLLNSDDGALLKTQVLRVPYTFNMKDKPKEVRIISQFNRNTIKKYDINKLHKRFCQDKFRDGNDNVVISLSNNYPPCVANALKDGSKVGSRNKDLFNIVVALKQCGNNVNQIKFTIGEWNKLNEEPLPNVENEVERIYSNYNGYVCNDCMESNKINCRSYTISDFNLEQYNENIIDIQSKVGRQARNSKRKGVATMEGNELFIYNVLVNNKGFADLNIDMIIERITDRKTKKPALSKPTISKALKGLEDKGYISIVKGNARKGIKDTYLINEKKVTPENSFRMSYFINILVIKGDITTTELKVYTHMRYLHHQDVIKSNAKGNIFVRSRHELSKSLGMDENNVAKAINNLYENMVLDRRSVPHENKSNHFHYEYKLNM